MTPSRRLLSYLQKALLTAASKPLSQTSVLGVPTVAWATSAGWQALGYGRNLRAAAPIDNLRDMVVWFEENVNRLDSVETSR